MKRVPAFATATVAVAAFALSGCAAGQAGSSGSGEAVSDGSVKMALAGDPGKLNPLQNATNDSETVAAFGYESLLTYPTGKEAEGLLAEKWEGTTTSVTFTLKQGITCQDGTALTASDVKGTFELANKKETGSPYKGVYFPAEGLTIKADDAARTIEFTSEQAQSFLAETIGALPIVCKSGLENPDSLDTEQHGTGPYQLTSATAGQSYSFTRRDGYTWGPNGVTSETEGLPKTVDLTVVESASTAANLLQSGELQLAEVGGTDRDRLEATTFKTKLEIPMRPGMFFFNQAEGRPGNSLEVRTAIAQGIDREALGKVASAGHGETLTTLVSSFGAACTTMDSSASIPSADVDAAKTALDAAGWKVGSDGYRSKDGKQLKLVLLYPSKEGAGVTSAIELLQTQLKELGINGIPTPSAAYTDVIFQGGDWDMVWAPIFTSLPSDWQGILSGEFPPNGGNWTYNTNEEYFSLAADAQKLAGSESCGAWQKAQDSLFSDVEVLPIASTTSTLYGTNVEFAVNKTILAPTTLRVTK
jgi:peptide/nickel transport system substrate-binding protein